MAGNVGSLALTITANSADMVAGVSQALRALEKLGKQADRTQEKTSGKGGGGSAGGGLLGGLGVIGLAAGGIGAVIGALKSAAEYTIGLAMSAETAKLRFSNLFGSVEEGGKAFAGLQQIARQGGLSMDELAPVATELSRAGVAANELLPAMNALAKVSAGTGTPLAELAELLAKVRRTGELTSRELRTLSGPVLEALAANLGVPAANLKQMAESGQLGVKELSGAFASLTKEGGRFGDALEKNNNTMAGKLASLTETMKQGAAEMGQSLIDGLDLKGALDGVRDFVGMFKGSLETIRPVIEILGGYFRAYGQILKAQWAFWSEAWESFGKPVFEQVKAWLADLTGGAIPNAGEAWLNMAEFALKGLAYVVDSLKIAAGAILTYLVAPILRAVSTVLDFGGWWYKIMGPTMLQVFKPLMQTTFAFVNSMSTGMRFISQSVADMVVTVGGVLKDFFGKVILGNLLIVEDVLNKMFKNIPEAAVPKWVKNMREDLGSARKAVQAGMDFDLSGAANKVKDAFDVADRLSKAGQTEALAGLDKLLGQGALGDFLKGASDKVDLLNAGVKELGQNLLGVKLGDSLPAVDAFMDRVRDRFRKAANVEAKLDVGPIDVKGAVKSKDFQAGGAALQGSAAAESILTKYALQNQNARRADFEREQREKQIKLAQDLLAQLKEANAALRKQVVRVANF